MRKINAVICILTGTREMYRNYDSSFQIFFILCRSRRLPRSTAAARTRQKDDGDNTTTDDGLQRGNSLHHSVLFFVRVRIII